MKQQYRFIGIYFVDTDVKKRNKDLQNVKHENKDSEKRDTLFMAVAL